MTIPESLKLEGRMRSVFGRMGEPRREPGEQFDEELREARLATARRCSAWTEIEEVDLVPRGPRNAWFVSASNDEVFEPYRGVVFQTGSASVIADQAKLAFYVDRDGDVVFLERRHGTWSEHVARRARRSGAAA